MSLISVFKTPIIEFLCEERDFGIIKPPVPAGKCIPEWYKKVPVNMGPEHRDVFGGEAMTAKKCIPLIDAMTLGFIIPLYGDTNIKVSKTGEFIETSPNPQGGGIIELHDKSQLGGKSSPTYPGPAVKFINKWIIKTAPGYSTLFIPPMNSIEDRFICLSGFVDTDRYARQINFPGIWLKKDCDEILLAGTPLVTCIPIKRSQLPKEAPIRIWTPREKMACQKTIEIQKNRNHYYTKELREKR